LLPELASEAKISNFDGLVHLVNKNVGRLEVSMNKTILMNVLDRTEHLTEEDKVRMPVNLSIRSIEVISESFTWAILHLDHHVNRLKLLLILDEV
jgi:hypothetical protein